MTSASNLPALASVMALSRISSLLARKCSTSIPGYFFLNSSMSALPQSATADEYQSTLPSFLAASYNAAVRACAFGVLVAAALAEAEGWELDAGEDAAGADDGALEAL